MLQALKGSIRSPLMGLFERLCLMRHPPQGALMHQVVRESSDPVRHATLALAIHRILKENIPGSFAEVGVYRGTTSRVIHQAAPDRRLYLFDTFEGFPEQDLTAPDARFRNTDLEILRQNLGDMNNVVVRRGYFPETAKGLESDTFALVMLDLDLYKPMAAGMEFFYPRLTPGGYLFAHDFNSPESNFAVSRAVGEFLADKPERLIEIPDPYGSVVFRKL